MGQLMADGVRRCQLTSQSVTPPRDAHSRHTVDLYTSADTRRRTGSTHVASRKSTETTITKTSISFLVQKVLKVLQISPIHCYSYGRTHETQLPGSVLVSVSHSQVEDGIVERPSNEPFDR